jgi:very-short-patch-repair endonuclease
MKRRSKEELEIFDKQFKISLDNNGDWIGFRICPSCNKEIKHYGTSKQSVRAEIEYNRNCWECEVGNRKFYDVEKYGKIEPVKRNGKWIFYRNCPECNKKIKYSSKTKSVLIRNVRNSFMANCLCGSCSIKGNRNSMANPENRKKLSNKHRMLWDSGVMEKNREIMRINSRNMQALRPPKVVRVSKLEKEIKKFLKENNIKTVSQFPIGSFKYDFLIKEKNLLIEVNGDYWHCNPKKYSPEFFHLQIKKTAQDIWADDNNKTKIAKDNGYNIITIWESDYKENKEETIKQIINYGK